MNEEDINKEDIDNLIKTIKKISPKQVTVIIVICLFFLFYFLGYIWGYNLAFRQQEEYYEKKIAMFCICQEKPYFYGISQEYPLNANS